MVPVVDAHQALALERAFFGRVVLVEGAGGSNYRAAPHARQQQAQAQGAAQQQATAEQVGNFKKAFSVCLEAKEYMVKF